MTRARFSSAFALAFALACDPPDARAGSPEIVVGSKRFTESRLLAELALHAVRSAGTPARHAEGLGGTAIVFRALESGAIDLYPEYTGTLAEAVLHLPGRPDLAAVREALVPRGLCLSDGLGFENTYALAVKKTNPKTAGVARIGELGSHPELVVGVSNEMAGRPDGWPGLAAAYGLTRAPRAMDHGLAYEAIANGSIDVVEVYSTDAKIARFGLRVLEDEKKFFPSYEAVFVYRCAARARFPAAFAKLDALAATLDPATMVRWNAEVELDGLTPESVVAAHVAQPEAGRDARPGAGAAGGDRAPARASFLARLVEVVRVEGPTHVGLVLVSVLASTLCGVPLGILAQRSRRLRGSILGTVGVIQTIPSLALLCFLIPLLGIGTLPTLVALFLYGLLPIAANTYQGLADISPALRESAIVLGLTPRQRLVSVELPLAARAILAGVRTSAVVAVGTATVAAFAGAGGFGQPISTGLNLNDSATILLGAIPAALLAFLVGVVFSALENVLTVKGRS